MSRSIICDLPYIMKNKHTIILQILLAMVVSGIVLTACVAKRPKKIQQGVEGVITQLTGNQMPMVGKPAAKPRPLAAEVFFYEATTVQQAQGTIPVFSKVNTRMVAKVKSDATGHYQVALAPGSYSIFIKQSTGLFASETDGAGVLTPVTVVAGQVSQRNITVTLGAAF